MPITITSRFPSLRESVRANCASRTWAPSSRTLCHGRRLLPAPPATRAPSRSRIASERDFYRYADTSLRDAFPILYPTVRDLTGSCATTLASSRRGLCTKDEPGSQDVVAVYLLETTPGTSAGPRYKAGELLAGTSEGGHRYGWPRWSRWRVGSPSVFSSGRGHCEYKPS